MSAAALAAALGWMLVFSAASAAAPSASGPFAQSARQRPLLVMRVNPHERGPRLRVPRSFTGFSFEYPSFESYIGSVRSGVNPILLGLLDNIAATGSGRPNIRLGGGSADEVWWNPGRRKAKPRGITWDITYRWVAAVQAFLLRSGTRSLILGLNLAHRNPAIARDWMRVARDSFGRRIKTFEVGNEPDIYSIRGYGETATGKQLYARGRHYGFRTYLREFGRRARALRGAGRRRLAGPAATGVPDWLKGLPVFLRRFRRRINLVTYHIYQGNNCPGVRRSNPNYVTRGRLLGFKLLGRVLHIVRPLVLVARHFHRGVRLTESASAACGGKKGVSDVFASALWAPNYLFGLMSMGLKGVNFHTGGFYTPFTFPWGPRLGWRASVAPLYYGTLFFAQATAHRARLLLGSLYRSRRRRGVKVLAWPTVDRRGTVRVAVVNGDSRHGGRVRIRVRGAAGRGVVTRLTAPSLRSRKGVTLAGQSVPTTSPDGRLSGPYVAENVRRRRGTYVFSVPRGSAALLTVHLRRSR